LEYAKTQITPRKEKLRRQEWACRNSVRSDFSPSYSKTLPVFIGD